MRWLLPLAFVLCACGGGSEDVGGKVGEATIAGCNDTNGAHEPDHRVEVRAVRGVDPLYAVFIGGDLYENTATFPELKSHPLYDGPVRARMKGPRCRIAGRVERQFSGFSVAGRIVRVFTNTDVRVARAYLPDGIPVVITGRRCKTDLVFAERIEPG
jgi:hypothetical protein